MILDFGPWTEIEGCPQYRISGGIEGTVLTFQRVGGGSGGTAAAKPREAKTKAASVSKAVAEKVAPAKKRPSRTPPAEAKPKKAARNGADA